MRCQYGWLANLMTVSEPVSSTAPAPSGESVWSPTSGVPTPACAWCGAPLGSEGGAPLGREGGAPLGSEGGAPLGDSSDEGAAGRIRCHRCGVATTSPWPTDAQLDAAYGDWYRPASGRFGGIGDALLRRTRATLAKRIDRLAPPGPVLDVGAGDGTLVAALRRHGRDAVGLERHAHGPQLRDDDIADLTGSWSAIVFWHSLEHLREPGDALAHAVRLLAPGGLLVVALPNAASRQAVRFGDRWLALDLPRHLVHVTADALVARMRDLGLQPSRVSHVRGGQVAFGWAHGFVAQLPGHPDLYDAVRSPAARTAPMTGARRALTLLAGVVVAPAAVVATVVEVASRRGGSVYVEARR
jgi:SAM-dependent methyltransferase